MNIKSQIDEILSFIREDASYCAITGTINYGDIDPNIYKQEKVDGYSFDHIFYTQKGSPSVEDYFTGIALIPIGEFIYAICEWNS